MSQSERAKRRSAIGNLRGGAATDDSADDTTDRELGEQQAIVASADHVDASTYHRDNKPEGEVRADDLRRSQRCKTE